MKHSPSGFYTWGFRRYGHTLNEAVATYSPDDTHMTDYAPIQPAPKGMPIKQENKMDNEAEKKQYMEQQKKFVKNAKLKKGSEVTVAQKVNSNQGGWADVWEPHMDAYVGQVGKVFYANDVLGVLVQFDDGMVCAFPFFALTVGAGAN